jgi:hypothetical protein
VGNKKIQVAAGMKSITGKHVWDELVNASTANQHMKASTACCATWLAEGL